MSAFQIGLLFVYAVGMSLGQLLFKFAAQSMSRPDATAFTISDRIFQLGLNPYFVAATVMYFGLSVLWVWILTFIPLSRAYPFVALAFIFTPLLSCFFFAEALDLRFYFGVSFIIGGLILVIH